MKVYLDSAEENIVPELALGQPRWGAWGAVAGVSQTGDREPRSMPERLRGAARPARCRSRPHGQFAIRTSVRPRPCPRSSALVVTPPPRQRASLLGAADSIRFKTSRPNGVTTHDPLTVWLVTPIIEGTGSISP